MPATLMTLKRRLLKVDDKKMVIKEGVNKAGSPVG